MTFGDRLVDLRKERGFTNRKDFASYIGMPSTTLRNYETNVREPGHVFLKQMSDIFHVTIDYLLCMTDDRTPPNQLNLFSPTDVEHIKKYHDLDDHGKKTVDIILTREAIRTETIRNLSGQENGLTTKDMEKIWSKMPKNPEEFEKKYPPIDLDKNKETG